MNQNVGSPAGRTKTVSGKFTEDEESQVKTLASQLGIDVSAFVRQAVLHELAEGGPINTGEILLELFIRDREASIELGSKYSVAKFREICGQVKAAG